MLAFLGTCNNAEFTLSFTMIHCIRLSNQLSHQKPIFVDIASGHY